MEGTVGILSVGAGDTKLTFDRANPAERIRAARIVKDMIRRGYALLIATGTNAAGEPIYERATDFDEQHCEYIIADFDPVTASEADEQERRDEQAAAATAGAPAAEAVEKPRRGRPRGKVQRFDAEKTRAVAVSRSAGG